MIREDVGQISLEYMLIFTISLIILIVFTLPLAELTIKDTFDISDTLNTKNDVSKIAQAIKRVYGEGQGSKQVIHIKSSDVVKLNIGNDYISANLKMNDGSEKLIKENFNSKLEKSTITLNKGENTIVIEWPVGGGLMKIYKI